MCGLCGLHRSNDMQMRNHTVMHLRGRALASDKGREYHKTVRTNPADDFNDGIPCVQCPICLVAIPGEAVSKHIGRRHSFCDAIQAGVRFSGSSGCLENLDSRAVFAGMNPPRRTSYWVNLAMALLNWDWR